MRRIKNIKVKIAMKQNIYIGDHFMCKDIEWVCLDIVDGNYLAITTKSWKELPFDVDNQNNWKESSLRKVLNEEFLDKLDKKYLVMQTSNLIADNGDNQYGACDDFVTILSCDQYRKYRDIMPHYLQWMWTLTPWNCSGNFVRSILPTDHITEGNAYYTNGVAPVVLFSSKTFGSPYLGIQKTKSIRKS